MKKLFELSSCYDGADDLFSANSREEVAEYMLKEIRKYLENKEENSKGAKYFRILRMINAEIINSKKGYNKISNNGFRWDDFEQTIFEKRMRKITHAQLLGRWTVPMLTEIRMHKFVYMNIDSKISSKYEILIKYFSQKKINYKKIKNKNIFQKYFFHNK